MKYVDGYVLPVPKKNIETYRQIAKMAGKAWIRNGALEYRECVIEDASSMFGLPFPQLAKVKKTETVIFSWVVFKSRAHRDKVNAKVMTDDCLTMPDGTKPVFDFKRMSYGGFEMIVDESAKPKKPIRKATRK